MEAVRGLAVPAQGAAAVRGREPDRVHRRVCPGDGTPAAEGVRGYGGAGEGGDRKPRRGANGGPLLAQRFQARPQAVPLLAD